MATFVTHSRITTSQIGKNGKGYQKKKKTHTHTFFFNEESTINDTLRVGVKSFNEESTLNDTYK